MIKVSLDVKLDFKMLICNWLEIDLLTSRRLALLTSRRRHIEAQKRNVHSSLLHHELFPL